MQRILVIDDDPAVTRLLKRGLFYEGFSVILAGSGEAGLTLARDYPPDLVVLDIVLPGIDGLEVLRRLHAADPQLPILILTAKDAPADQVLGLESGADDYVVKPFIFAVLLARVRALLRRQHAEHPSVLTFTDLALDRSSRQVRRGQREIVLTSLEFKLLQTFLEHPQQLLAKDTLLSLVWGADFGVSRNLVEVYVKQLRQKFGGWGRAAVAAYDPPRRLHPAGSAGRTTGRRTGRSAAIFSKPSALPQVPHRKSRYDTVKTMKRFGDTSRSPSVHTGWSRGTAEPTRLRKGGPGTVRRAPRSYRTRSRVILLLYSPDVRRNPRNNCAATRTLVFQRGPP